MHVHQNYAHVFLLFFLQHIREAGANKKRKYLLTHTGIRKEMENDERERSPAQKTAYKLK